MLMGNGRQGTMQQKAKHILQLLPDSEFKFTIWRESEKYVSTVGGGHGGIWMKDALDNTIDNLDNTLNGKVAHKLGL